MSLVTQIQTLLTDAGDLFAKDEAAQKALISSFLQDAENNTIRVYVPAASGMGHQATTVLIMNRLIELGFNHNYEVIFDNSDGNTANKLAKLIPGFDPTNIAAPQDVEINDATTATMITLTYFNANTGTYPEKNFGITGGFDTNATNLANASTGVATSKGVNVKFFLKLQPFQWNKQNAIQQPGQASTDYTLLTAVDALGGASFTKRGFYVHAPQAPADTDFGTDAAKLAAYNTIIGASTGDAPAVNLLPIYGIGDNQDFPGYVEANPNIKPENVLLYLISSIRYAQQFSAVPSLQKGAVLVVIATVSDGCYTNLNQLLSGIAAEGRNTAIDKLNQFVTSVGAVAGDITTNNVEVISYNDGDNDWLTAKIAAVSANKVLVIKMAGLPLAAFDYMYASSSLPCLLEGKGTANLVLNLNKPYYNLLQSTSVVYPTLPLTAANGPEATQCNSAVLDFKDSAATTNGKLPDALILNPPSAGFTNTAMYKLATMAEDAYTGGNALQTYFAGLQTFFQNEQEDKLFLSLLYFLSYVNALDAE